MYISFWLEKLCYQIIIMLISDELSSDGLNLSTMSKCYNPAFLFIIWCITFPHLNAFLSRSVENKTVVKDWQITLNTLAPCQDIAAISDIIVMDRRLHNRYKLTTYSTAVTLLRIHFLYCYHILQSEHRIISKYFIYN